MLAKLGTKWAEIDLDAIQHNLDAIRRRIGKRSILAVVKADAYGHGAVEVAKCCERAGVRMLGVSSVDEGIQLRENFIDLEVLIMGPALASQACDVINYNLTATVASEDFAQALDTECGRLGKRVNAHLVVDTGMGRIGPDEAVPMAQRLLKLPHVALTGVYSHFRFPDPYP